MKPEKATREQLQNHNRQLILRLVHGGRAASRAALAVKSGLTKPTVGKLVNQLIDEGYLVEGGYGSSSDAGGKRPRIVEFQPGARQVIGLDVNPRRVRGVLTDLNGHITTRHLIPIQPDAPLLPLVTDAINGLTAQLTAPLLGVGVGIPAVLDDDGNLRYVPNRNWKMLEGAHLRPHLQETLRVPVHMANTTELAARAHYVFRYGGQSSRHLTIYVNNTVGVAGVLGPGIATLGSDIGRVRLHTPHGEQPVEDVLAWDSIAERIAALCADHPDSLLGGGPPSYLRIQWAAARQDAAAVRLFDELAEHLARVIQWGWVLLRPHTVVIAGDIAYLGPTLLDKTLAQIQQWLPAELLETARFELDDTENLVAIGAAAHVIQQELGLA